MDEGCVNQSLEQTNQASKQASKQARIVYIQERSNSKMKNLRFSAPEKLHQRLALEAQQRATDRIPGKILYLEACEFLLFVFITKNSQMLVFPLVLILTLSFFFSFLSKS